MLPIDFPGRNRILHGPRDEQGNPTSDIIDLPSFTDDQVCVSRWELSDDEKQQLRHSLGIYVFLWYDSIDPIYLSVLCPINDDETIKVQPVQKDVLYKGEDRGEKFCITYWEFTDDEIELIQTIGAFWFVIQSGETQPPVGFMAENPFTPETII
ncbi:hypothetical protein [Spirosoma aerolatum]|uniref:hypothetical protein n=1 Tax=Spirosoma aerolatum TaxID=1211326 RepID=UPI0009AC1DE7|nr:hypothetical protein [Spirosoma aerolatum]